MSREAHTAGMITQANKSRSAKQYRVGFTSRLTDMDKHESACTQARGDTFGTHDEFMYGSQAIASLSSKTISDAINSINTAWTSWWGYAQVGMIVLDVETQTVVMEHWA